MSNRASSTFKRNGFLITCLYVVVIVLWLANGAYSGEELPTTCSPETCKMVEVAHSLSIDGTYRVNIEGYGSTAYSGIAPTTNEPTVTGFPSGTLNPNVRRVHSYFNARATQFAQEMAAVIATLEAVHTGQARVCESSCQCVGSGDPQSLSEPITENVPDFGHILADIVNGSSLPVQPGFPPATGTATLIAKILIQSVKRDGKCNPQ